MPDTHLGVYLGGRRIGSVAESDGAHRLTFDDEWRWSSGRLELSAGLVKSQRVHEGPRVSAYLQGLLPDDARVRSRWAARFQTANTPLGLLRHIGLDCAGAVQFSTTTSDDLDLPGGLEPVDDADVAEHLAALRGDPSAWAMPADHGGYFSLAGMQSKFALRRTDDGWAVPWGSEPSTHILKPGIFGLPHQGVVEHLTQRAARAFGIDAAATTIERFGDEVVLAVERYDRVRHPDGTVERVHQEDFVQALGIDPETKYESDGGPGIRSCAGLLRDALRGRAATAGIRRFVEGVVFHWVAVSTDAHAKNSSLLHTARGSDLAPMYDAASALAYERVDGMHPKQVKLAMKLGSDYRVDSTQARHVARTAADVGVDPQWVLERARSIASAFPDAISDGLRALADAEVGVDDAFRTAFLDAAARRSAAVIRSIDQMGPLPAAGTQAASARTASGRFAAKRGE